MKRGERGHTTRGRGTADEHTRFLFRVWAGVSPFFKRVFMNRFDYLVPGLNASTRLQVVIS
jgi:hypothetical protein